MTNISYCKPGRADNVYCGKNNRGDKICKSNDYLLWIIQDMVKLFNIEKSLEKVSYYLPSKSLKIGQSKDDYRFEKCECGVAAFRNKTVFEKTAGYLEKKRYQKDEVVDSGVDVIIMLKEILKKSFKIYVYNISHQYSELKHLKATSKGDEIIFSVDFSKNYDKKQHHEIQSAYFGHEAFTLHTAACYYRSHDNDWACVDKDAVFFASNETIHEQNIAFFCNMKVL